MKSPFVRVLLLILCGGAVPPPDAKGEGPACQIVVDAAHVARQLPSNPTGFCMSFLSDGDRAGLKPMADVLAPMRPGSLRYPMGTLAENYLFHDLSKGPPAQGHLRPCAINRSMPPGNWDWAVRPDGSFAPGLLDFDHFMEICRTTKAEPVVLVATYGHLCPQAMIDEEGLFRNAEEWVRYANLQCHYGVRYWELGNEVDLKEVQAVMPRPQYLRIYRQLAARMKAVDPTIHTGLGISHFSDDGTPYCQEALQQFPQLVDFIVAHQYGDHIKTYDEFVAHKSSFVPDARGVLRAIDAFAPADRRAGTEVLVTEFSSFSKDRDRVRKGNNIFNALYTFGMLSEMVALDPRVRFADFWVTHSPWGNHHNTGNSPAFSPDDNHVLPQGRAVEIVSRFIGDRVVRARASTRALSVLATVGKGGGVAVWLSNRSQQSVPAVLTLQGLPSLAALQGWTLRGSAPDDLQPYWGKADGVRLAEGKASLVVPPLSILVLYSPPPP